MPKYMITELVSIQGYKKVYYMVEAESERDVEEEIENFSIEPFDEEVTITDSEFINFEVEEK